MARFVVSHRLAGPKDTRDAARDAYDKVETTLSRFASVRGTAAAADDSGQMPRRGVLIDAEPAEMRAHAHEWSRGMLVEPELPRHPAVLRPLRADSQTTGAVAGGPGAVLQLKLTHADGSPLANASVTGLLVASSGLTQAGASARSDAQGAVSLSFDPQLWTLTAVLIVPESGCWSWWQDAPHDGLTLALPALPSGPLGWWHLLANITRDVPERGKGIRIGVADTGAGPHPHLAHVQSIGAFTGGGYDATPHAGLDARDHGTHVCGIIGARPSAGSSGYVGLAPAAELLSARVFGDTGGANQLDIANAVDALAHTQRVDLINLSLGAAEPSSIELDALTAALEAGTLTLCAAGNANGAPVFFPAAYPQAVAVSALGLWGTTPAGSLAAKSIPSQPDHYAAGGLYCAAFANVGPQVTCTAPGVGIVSTVPARNGAAAPYADMSGTSMACPLACGALATLLALDPSYQALPRDASRAQRATQLLLGTLRPLGLSPSYEGRGLVTGWS